MTNPEKQQHANLPAMPMAGKPAGGDSKTQNKTIAFSATLRLCVIFFIARQDAKTQFIALSLCLYYSSPLRLCVSK